MQAFTHLSPIPYPTTEVLPSGGLAIGPMTPQECVEFFWLTSEVSLDFSVRVFEQHAKSGDVLVDITKAAHADNFCSATMPFSLEPRARCTASGKTLCDIFLPDGGLDFQISGPYVDAHYPQEISFASKSYYYKLAFHFGAGSLEIDTNYSTNTGPAYMTTVKRFPFTIFDKTYYLNLNVPDMYLNPAQYELNVSYSADLSLSRQTAG